MKSIIRRGFLSTFGTFQKPKPGIHILNSHFISRINSDPNKFFEQLKRLNKECSFIRIEEAVALITKRTSVTKPLIAFSYDDGYEECYDFIAPALEIFKTNAVFFINPGFIDGDEVYKKKFVEHIVSTPGKKPMNWAQIKELSTKGHIIGSHTINHINLQTTNLDILHHQLGDSKKIIEVNLQTLCDYFAYPYGQKHHLSEEALEVASLYYKYIFSGTDYRNYFSFNNRVINRRHVEGDWPCSHVIYFLKKKSY